MHLSYRATSQQCNENSRHKREVVRFDLFHVPRPKSPAAASPLLEHLLQVRSVGMFKAERVSAVTTRACVTCSYALPQP
jgi:hypothetical protein